MYLGDQISSQTPQCRLIIVIHSQSIIFQDCVTNGTVSPPSHVKFSFVIFQQEHEVEKMFPLSDKGLPPSNVQNIIFVTRPKLHLMEQIAQNLLQ